MDDKDSEQRGRAIVQSLAVVVQSMLQPADSMPPAYAVRSKFEAFRAPNITIRDYLMRINKYAACSPECFVLALVYIDRLHQMQGLILTDLNVHRVLITSVVLAAKFFDDHYFNNAYYSKVGGVPCSEMNELEVEFLLMTNFTLHVSTDLYVRYYNELASHYVFNSLHGGIPHHQFRHYVVMDPKQEGQLIYVAGDEVDEPPLPSYDEERKYYEEQQQRPAQAPAPAPAPVYAYQQPQQQPTTSFVSTHGAVASSQQAQQQQEQPHHAPPPAPVYAYQSQQQHQPMNAYVPKHTATTQHQLPYNPTHQYNHSASYYHHSHRSSIEDGSGIRHSSAAVHGKYVSVPPAAPAASIPSSTSNGIVYASAGRTSGQKRRKSIALGVNA